MKEHYSVRLKRQSAETEAQRVIAVNALKQIALGKSTNAQNTADAALREIGFLPFVLDVNVPPDLIIGLSGQLSLNREPDGYF